MIRIRMTIVTRAALVFLALAAPVFANAPIGGDAQQYANFLESDTTILDRKTHLRWTRAFSAPMGFVAAKTDCTNGTRLPSMKELLTIVDEMPHLEHDVDDVERERTIDKPAFPDTPPEAFWTSSVDANSPDKAWSVYFADGTTVLQPTSGTARVRCVKFEK